MLERWLINIVISFVLRQLARFKGDIDWAKVRADMNARVAALVPGSWFDDEACYLANALLDGVLVVLGSSAELEKLLQLLAASNWSGAFDALKDLLTRVWIPTGGSAKKAHALLTAA